MDYSRIEFPVAQRHYNKVENNININVFGYEEKQPHPIYMSKEKFEDQINLLLITKGEKKHYVLMKDLNKFVHNQTKHNGHKYFLHAMFTVFFIRGNPEETHRELYYH